MFTTTLSRRTGRNPSSDASIVYVAGGNSGSEYAPALFETVVRDVPVAVLVAVTVTPGRAPPESSVRRPETDPVLLCARRGSAMMRQKKSRKRVRRTLTGAPFTFC
jgi:hypothetical protein